jgi:peptidoglycan L-alanyl-D-glutamate endopeptidase CwlK
VVEGKSKTRWPTSKHNAVPSLAVDLVPCPVDWKDRERFILLAGIVIGIAWKLGIPVRWGGDWDGDSNIAEHSFQDLPHFELIGEGGK